LNDKHDAFVGERRIVTDISVPKRTCLETLGLGLEATEAQIKAAYRKLLKRYHPDKNKGDRSGEVRMRRIIEAYNYLIVPRAANGWPVKRSKQ